ASNDIVMPIVQQVQMVLEGEMRPENLGPHLATEDGIPKRELVLGGESRSIWRRLFGRRKGAVS
ncbi:MAG: NAD(P)H-dependent glycerol-3-phosphate dehydrogenase, partial [Leucobacter sp.]